MKRQTQHCEANDLYVGFKTSDTTAELKKTYSLMFFTLPFDSRNIAELLSQEKGSDDIEIENGFWNNI